MTKGGEVASSLTTKRAIVGFANKVGVNRNTLG